MNKKIFSKIISLIIVVFLLIFVLYPFICMLDQSIHINGVFSFENYIYVFKNYKQAILNSITVAIWTSVFTTIMSLILVLFIFTKGKIIKNLLMVIILIGFIQPPFVSSLSYIVLYGRRGLITYNLLNLNTNPYTVYGIILMQIISFIPLNVIYLNSNIERIDKNILQSAKDLGASGKRILFDIIIPMLSSSIIVVFFLTFIRSICDFSIPTIVGGRYQTFSSEIYVKLIGASDLEKSAVMNVILMIPSIVIFIFYLYGMRKNEDKNISRTNLINNLELKKLGIYKYIINIIGAVYILIIFLQYFAIVFYSLFKKVKTSYVFTLEYLNKFFNYNFTSLIRSIVYAIIVSIFCIIFSILFNYKKRKKDNLINNFLDFIIMMPYMLPGTYFGISYILAFNKEPIKLTGTAVIVILNIIFKQLPITNKMCDGAFKQIPKDIENSCYDLGGNELNVICDVIIPKIKNTITDIFIYNFNSALTTYGSILFLINPRRKLAIFDLFDKIYIGEYHDASVLSCMIIIVVIVVSLIVKYIGNINKNMENKNVY